MTTHTTAADRLAEALRDVLPDNAIQPAGDAFAIDEVTPSLVITPADETETAAVLAEASRQGAALIARGAGAHTGLGRPPLRYDAALALHHLNHIVEYEPADLTVTVQAGMLLSQLQQTLAANGQWLPLDPPAPDGTIGGLLAANRSGPARISQGSARDLVIGMRVLTAEGAAVRSGGRVVKNVAGYDMAKLHIGALGSLGVITEVSFKIAPLPKHTAVLHVEGPLLTVISLVFQLRNRGLAVRGLEILQTEPGVCSLIAHFAGGVAAVERSLQEATGLARDAGLQTSETPPPAAPTGSTVARISVQPTQVAAFCEQAVAQKAAIVAYPTAGTVSASWGEQPPLAVLSELRREARRLGGALVLERGTSELKHAFDVWGEPGGDFAFMQRLKHQFDLNGILSPGRFMGGL